MNKTNDIRDADAIARQIIEDCTSPALSEGLTLAKLKAATDIMNSAKMEEIWNGYEFVKCPQVAPKTRWRLFPQFWI